MGWYRTRLAWNIVPPLLAIAAILLSSVRRQRGRAGGAVLAVAVGAVTIGWTVHEIRRDYLFALPSPPASERFLRGR